MDAAVEEPTIIEAQLPARYFNRAGRKPGSRNRISSTAKENIQKVFEGLGGWESMMDWAVNNRTEFYGSVYPRLLANEGPLKGSEGIRVIVYAPNARSPNEVGANGIPPVVGHDIESVEGQP